MAANPIVVVRNGVAQIPVEFEQDPRFHEGARLELVPVPVPVGTPMSEPERWAEFMKLRGLLKNSSYDPNAELEAEKQRELAEEAGWRNREL